MTDRFDEKARLLASMSNAARLRLLIFIVEGELSVGALAARVGISQSALSQHLAKLRDSKLVTTRRDAQTVYYRCDHVGVQKILHILGEIALPQGDGGSTGAQDVRRPVRPTVSRKRTHKPSLAS
ncbi:ArsR/SmtB family transcription factor [Agrobacterium tumefaciens]|uniref:ArsR/SmtB family transcription factor n=1 Tax=Agrobacterium tumefaciens TaxID=358 RepID=UPI0015724178|nr:metalloregulator ArsR/SmtB family transcription factor [Agrobacterium tumefaciens]NTD87684.1 winged helix-turn-helix transcriptional regulator [Agrobacterium tumefaciens]NTD91559.1 winged helix-turn-helix transcriptional regulator [Agrobacterium tumefaciens]NTD95544.1 winged helix-turn-helix transcriptional regulator [Agrobacterium tumefaciens]NTE11654.1 winged helix-turn-helix transcriptional regulator [Agrobacterium tumefaciens]NTE25099.1 winged helix-turn-helix transcriptional regulator 